MSHGKSLYDIYAEVLPHVLSSVPLPEDFACRPEYQAAYALWTLIARSGATTPAVRMTALREYYDRVHGKPSSDSSDTPSGLEELDLSRLSDSEAAELVRLLEKARPDEDRDEDQSKGQDK